MTVTYHNIEYELTFHVKQLNKIMNVQTALVSGEWFGVNISLQLYLLFGQLQIYVDRYVKQKTYNQVLFNHDFISKRCPVLQIFNGKNIFHLNMIKILCTSTGTLQN